MTVSSPSSEASPVPPRFDLPDLGVGVGLRTPHYRHILEKTPDVDWFEVLSENYLKTRGRPRWVLDQVAERYPVVFHGVSMSIGSPSPLDLDHLHRLKTLADEVGARWISDHLCWTGFSDWNSHDLLPLPYHEESLQHVVQRVKTVQDILERPLILENASSYATFRASTLDEATFLKELCQEADCGLLLDVNNIYVSCRNHDWSVDDYLDTVPLDRVVQFHLAGHQDHGTHCIDTHDGPVVERVWEMYRTLHARTGGRSTLLEWDQEIPPFDELLAEARKASAVRAGAGVSP